jgi:hypothetical protein
MGAFTVNTRNNVLGWLVGRANPPSIGPRYLAMYNGDPQAGGTEVYQRVEVTSKMGTPAAGSVSNTADIMWPRTTSSVGTVTHLAMFDASSGGTMLASGPLTASVVIGSNVTPTIPAGQLVISMT